MVIGVWSVTDFAVWVFCSSGGGGESGYTMANGCRWPQALNDEFVADDHSESQDGEGYEADGEGRE